MQTYTERFLSKDMKPHKDEVLQSCVQQCGCLLQCEVGVISAVAEEKDVVRCWIPLQKAQRFGLGTLEFQVGDQRIRFDDVEEGDVVTRTFRNFAMRVVTVVHLCALHKMSTKTALFTGDVHTENPSPCSISSRW